MREETKVIIDAMAGVISHLNRLIGELRKSLENDKPSTPNIETPNTLTRTEQVIFEVLVKHVGRVVPFETVAAAVNVGRNRKAAFTEGSLWVHVHRLREKGCNVACVRGRGYMLEVAK